MESTDSEGQKIAEGDIVKILTIPEWLVHDMDDASRKVVKSCEGTLMKINEIDEYGYAWVEKVTIQTESEYESDSFSMEPKYLLKQ